MIAMVTGVPNAVSFHQHFPNEEARHRPHYQEENLCCIIAAFRAQLRIRFTPGQP
jgi:hypothetical protein